MTEEKTLSSAQVGVVFLIIALAGARLLYGVLSENGLRETAALFIGLPAFLAIIITLTPRAKSATGMIMKGMIIAMLMSGIFLQEGFVCILMASPLFLAVGYAIGRLSDRNQEKGLKANALLLIPFLLLSLEGTSETLSFNRQHVVTVTRTIPAAEASIPALLAETPEFRRPLPPFLRLGFPRPGEASGAGLNLGDKWVIAFTSGEEAMGQLALVVTHRDANRVQFRAVKDSTPVAEWLTWQTTAVQWQAIDAQHTRVTLTITAERRLAPAFYFGPLEQIGLEQAASYLADSLLAVKGEE